MILIWMERVYKSGSYLDDSPYCSVNHLVKVPNEDFQKVLSYYQKAWARREDMECEVTLQTYELAKKEEKNEVFYHHMTQTLLETGENGEKRLRPETDTSNSVYLDKFDKKALNYNYFYCVEGDPVFGGVLLEFELPILRSNGRLPSGVYANSFKEALQKAHTLN